MELLRSEHLVSRKPSVSLIYILSTSRKTHFYLTYSIQCWLTFALNLVVMKIAVILVTLAVELRDTSGGALDLALHLTASLLSALLWHMSFKPGRPLKHQQVHWLD